MKFKVSASLEYSIIKTGTVILNVHAFRSAKQTVIEETFIIDPSLRFEELTGGREGNRFIRFEMPESGSLSLSYQATIANSYSVTDYSDQKNISITDLDAAIFPYLYPSRYCQSDKLHRFANNKFGTIENAFQKVVTLTEWIHQNVEYLSGSTNSQTSAFDTITEQAGVCRDFAHLGIALCRALSIPARYFSGYASKLFPPDFHACFEAYINGQWLLFDATRLAPLNGLVKIATGLDAADTAIATIFGEVNFSSTRVSCEPLDNDFSPLFYMPERMLGISYS